MRKRKIRVKLPFKVITAVIILLGLIYLFFRSLSGFLWNSDYFNVKTIMVNEKDSNLSYLIGRNIFSLNLKKETEKISFLYPSYHKVIMSRQLPSCIKIELLKRAPIAYLRLYRFFAVDKEGVLFNPQDEGNLDFELPVILGLQTKILAPKSGKDYSDIKELSACIDFIQQASEVLKNYKIKNIDISQPKNLIFHIADGLEIKIGESNFTHKLRSLYSILENLSSDLGKIEYIDLRFKDPVIKYK